MQSHFFRRHYGYAVFSLLIFMPVILWLVHVGLVPFTSSFSQAVKSIGKGSAFMALAAYCLMPILSMRYKLLEKGLGGLDTLYKLHKKIGKIIFYLILAHPFFLIAGGLLAGKSLVGVWNWASIVVLTGLLSLFAVIALTAIAIYAHIRHQRWITIHRFFGWILPVLFVHALVARAQITTNPALFMYFVLLGSLGFAAFLYRSVLGRFLIKKYKYVVAEVNQVGPAVTELVLKPLAVPINYSPGQFAYLSVEADGVDREAHPFSFTTANNGPYVRFSIKELGDDTAKIATLQPGSKAYLEGPFGSFSYHNSKNKNQVWIAGGVGVTPFLSMARSFTKSTGFRVHLFYAAEELEDAIFLKELLAIRKSLPVQFDLTIVNRKISGFVTIDLLRSQIPDLQAVDFFICGPPAMMTALKEQLHKSGVENYRIYTEEFSLL